MYNPPEKGCCYHCTWGTYMTCSFESYTNCGTTYTKVSSCDPFTTLCPTPGFPCGNPTPPTPPTPTPTPPDP